jgi:hypothetical protein
MGRVIAFPIERCRPQESRHFRIFVPGRYLESESHVERAILGYAALLAGAFTGVLQVLSLTVGG